MNRINVGCGMTPTKGWRNLDNSWSIQIAKIGSLGYFLYKLGLIGEDTYANIKFCKLNQIERADVSRKIPATSETVEVLYTSHMLEHLDCNEARFFLRESFRVLKSGGIIRVAVPDLKPKIDEYIRLGDADKFIHSLYMGVPRPKTFSLKLRMLIVGTRHHQWMYDGNSLCSLLKEIGFKDPVVLLPGETTIINPGALDLTERADESLYVEAKKI